ncbi:MAG: DNA-3-methyladenine glycosylase [Actinomycetia bacterium]|nr:DNA-3-methyladenine glycosylase [Actinomycetes bacterium]
MGGLLIGDTLEVAPRLIGCILTTCIEGVTTSVRLTEVEAYGGSDDPASHAYGGLTARNRSMFLPQGHLYVYLSYGIHDLINIVTGAQGEPGAVLLRAGDPIEGRTVMEQRRGRTDRLTDGPGKLARALGLTLAHDGLRLDEASVSLIRPTTAPRILATPRIGITKASERPWRFVPATPTVTDAGHGRCTLVAR